MPEKPRKITRALLSVSDKTGLFPFANALVSQGVELVSTGGTAAALKDADLPVRDISEITGMPEMMDGRVKTLHPKVHGGLLAVRDNSSHRTAAAEHGILPIDLLAVSLYPFEETLAAGRDFDALIENIDIGGPAMIRAAAKNHDGVTVLVDPADYYRILAEMQSNNGATTLTLRRALAAKAYARTASYDAAISNWMAQLTDESAPAWRTFAGRLVQVTRYGENPHQKAALYVTGERRAGVASAIQLQGKELSYNNFNDTDAAFELVAEFTPEAGAAVAIIKHANPCGVAVGASLMEAYQSALRCDPVSAFGGIIATNREIDEGAALEMTKLFTEVVIAPSATDAAKAVFAKKPNLRLLTTGGLPDPRTPGLAVRSLAGALLVQNRDAAVIEDIELKVVTDRAPTEEELADLRFAFKIAKHVKSNAIVYAKDGATVGIGAGQMSRVDSTRIAAWKSEDAAKAAGLSQPLTKGSVVASDAFFPFADGLITAAEAGATAIIQPGGSMRDEEVISAANERGLAMVFTGVRHFRH